MRERTEKFIARINELDTKAEQAVGEGVVPWEDIVATALSEFHRESHNAALNMAIDVVTETGNQFADYDSTRDGHKQSQVACSAINELIIPIHSTDV